MNLCIERYGTKRGDGTWIDVRLGDDVIACFANEADAFAFFRDALSGRQLDSTDVTVSHYEILQICAKFKVSVVGSETAEWALAEIARLRAALAMEKAA